MIPDPAPFTNEFQAYGVRLRYRPEPNPPQHGCSRSARLQRVAALTGTVECWMPEWSEARGYVATSDSNWRHMA